MKVVISSQSQSLDGAVDPRFGRCAFFLVVDTENDSLDAVPNPGAEAMGGAGPMAAQKVSDLGAEAVITGNLGPKAADSLAALKIKVYRAESISAGKALDALKAGTLTEIGSATVGQHFGMK